MTISEQRDWPRLQRCSKEENSESMKSAMLSASIRHPILQNVSRRCMVYFLQNGTKEKIVMEIDETIFPNDIAVYSTFRVISSCACVLYNFAHD